MAEIIYLDSEFRCNRNGDASMMYVETTFFTGKCDAFVEGYRYVPKDKMWTRDDGHVFRGEMITPWKPFAELSAAQRKYEKQLLAEYAEALTTLGVTV